jgi:DNA-binding response OmpR family regulator
MNTTYHKVLIVEDEATLRGIIARNLAARGHEVTEADSVRAALECLDADQPDLVLLDISLPDRTGWDLLRQLGDEGNRVPVIIVSAVSLNADRLAEFKPLAYLPKPFPLESLLRIVDEGQEEEELIGASFSADQMDRSK